MKSILFSFCLAAVAVCSVFSAQESPDGRLAFVKDKELYIGKLDGSDLVQLTNDGVLKGKLHWSPDGKRLAYARQVDRSQSVAKIGLIDADGKEAREILFRPVGPQLIGGMRFVEESRWLDNDHLVVIGSINPNNCEYVVIDAATGKELRGYIGACDTFVASPNGAHVAYAGPPGIGVSEDDYRQCLEVDDKRAYTPSSPSGRLLTDAVWSADSATMAVLEHDLATKEKGVVVVSIGGEITRVPLPLFMEGTMSLRWVGSRLILEASTTRYSVDLKSKAVALAGLDVDDLFASEAAAKRPAEEAKKRGIATAKRLGVTRDEDIDVFVPPAKEK